MYVFDDEYEMYKFGGKINERFHAKRLVMAFVSVMLKGETFYRQPAKPPFDMTLT